MKSAEIQNRWGERTGRGSLLIQLGKMTSWVGEVCFQVAQ